MQGVEEAEHFDGSASALTIGHLKLLFWVPILVGDSIIIWELNKFYQQEHKI